MSCMYVWMSILPTQATEMVHPYIHTRTDAISESDEFPMYVYFSSPCIVETGFGLTGALKLPRFLYHPN